MPALPKRPEERIGHPKGATDGANGTKQGEAAKDFAIPPPNPLWAPYAQGWYRSLALSGQAKWYEPCDWAMAMLAADVLDLLIDNNYQPVTLFAEWSAITARLMATEGDRRRMRIELLRTGTVDPDEEAAETSLKEWRKKLKASQDRKAAEA